MPAQPLAAAVLVPVAAAVACTLSFLLWRLRLQLRELSATLPKPQSLPWSVPLDATQQLSGRQRIFG